MSDTEVIEVYMAANAAEAHALKNELENHGVDARVVGDTLTMAMGGLGMNAMRPRVWVRRCDEVRARELIACWGQQSAGTAEELWKCVQCGETIAGDLAVCWQCGTSRDGKPDAEFERQSEVEDDVGEAVWSPVQYGLMALMLVLTFFVVVFAVLRITASAHPQMP